MQGEALPAVVEFHVGEWHIPNHRVEFGQAGVAEVLDADVLAGVKRPGDPAGDAVLLHTDEPHALWRVAHEIAVPQPGSSTAAFAGMPSRARASCIAWMTVGEV